MATSVEEGEQAAMIHDPTMAGMPFRPGTLDHAVYDLVVRQNEYRLPDRLAPDDLVIDVGAHIGSFSLAAMQRGTQSVFAIEPDHENLKLASDLLASYAEVGSVELIHAAVWRSDANDDTLRISAPPPLQGFPGLEQITDTGGRSVMFCEAGLRVPVLPLDELVLRITCNGQRRVRLLKLDCEGAEWPILLTTKTLPLIDEICGEFHEIGTGNPGIDDRRSNPQLVFQADPGAHFQVDTLVQLLERNGFWVEIQRHKRPDGTDEAQGLFFARRPGVVR